MQNQTSSPLKKWLFDPSYSVYSQKYRLLFEKLFRHGHTIGLHPGFDSWASPSRIKEARVRLEQACGRSVHLCRQHWLRFSWQHTWKAQALAGLVHDSTLMFNDRAGFRTSSALCWHPWNPISSGSQTLSALPTVLMDSHLYDYQQLDSTEREKLIQHLISECKAVHGTMAVLWHPHTLAKDYSWSDGFNSLVKAITDPYS